MEVYNISQERLDRALALTNQTFDTLYSRLRHIVKTGIKDRYDSQEASSTIDAIAKNYANVFSAVSNEIKANNELSKYGEQAINFYSSNIAANVVRQDLEKRLGEVDVRELTQKWNGLSKKEIIGSKENDFTLVRKPMELLADYLVEKQDDPIGNAHNYMTEFSNQTNRELIRTIDDSHYKKLAEIKWNIGHYHISGLKSYEKRDSAPKDVTISVKEKSEFYSPLEPLNIDPKKILPQNRILGDTSLITDIKNDIKMLFFYDFNAKINPFVLAGEMENATVLQGPSGSGKGMVLYNVADYAKQFADSLGVDFMLTKFKFQSTYKDGSQLKLESQFNQAINENKIFLILQDEMDKDFNRGSSTGQEKSDHKNSKLLNLYLDGEMNNRGNNYFLGAFNNVKEFDPSLLSRFKQIYWEGAASAQQKSTLFKYKLEEGIRYGYVKVKDSEFENLGEIAYKNNLSGRDIYNICKKVKKESRGDFMNIWKKRGDINSQVEMIKKNHQEIFYNDILTALNWKVQNNESALKSSINYQNA